MRPRRPQESENMSVSCVSLCQCCRSASRSCKCRGLVLKTRVGSLKSGSQERRRRAKNWRAPSVCGQSGTSRPARRRACTTITRVLASCCNYGTAISAPKLWELELERLKHNRLDIAPQRSQPRKDSSERRRELWRSLSSAFSLICRTRSRVIWRRVPISSSVIGSAPSSPK